MKYFVVFLLVLGAFVILQNPAYAMCVYDPSNPPVTCDDAIGTLNYPVTPEELIPSPLKQMSLGIKLGHVICDDAHVLTYKTDYKPACVFPDSENSLLTRGWAKLRLLLPAGPDPIKELEITGQNELSYRITGNLIYGDDAYPLSNDRIREIVSEYSQKHHPDKQYLEYSIPTVQPFISVEDKVEFDLLEWGNYSDCWKLKLRIIDIQNKPVYEDSLANYCLEPDGIHGTFHSYSMGKDFEEFTCPHPGYYRIEVSNADVFPPKILQNFVCLEYKPEPAPSSESTQEQMKQQEKLLVQEIMLADTRETENKINAIRDYRDKFETGYFLEQFIHPNNQNFENARLMNFIYGEWGFQPTEHTTPKVTVYFRSYENYDKIEKINEWQRPKDDSSYMTSPDSGGYLMMDLHGMPPAIGIHETCTIPGEYRVLASNPDDESKVAWGYFTCQRDMLVGEPQPWMEIPE